jgi:hypothetical protein
VRQEAPDPETLIALLARLQYKHGWTFTLRDTDRGQGSTGLTLCILVTPPDSYNPDVRIRVMHYMPVPPAAYNERSWQRWLFTQILLVEQHEAAEFFKIGGQRPYAPLHGEGNDPYLIAELATDEDRRTTFRNELSAGRP